jgi:hypothetical protein
VVWTDQAKRGAEGFKILLEGAVGGPSLYETSERLSFRGR